MSLVGSRQKKGKKKEGMLIIMECFARVMLHDCDPQLVRRLWFAQKHALFRQAVGCRFSALGLPP